MDWIAGTTKSSAMKYKLQQKNDVINQATMNTQLSVELLDCC
jgi:hypothetical protein